MLRFLVIGIGPGDPELVTVKAVRAMNEADLLLIPHKGEDKADLAELRREICRRYLQSASTRVVEFDLPRRAVDADYLASVNDWHDAVAGAYASLVERYAPDGGTIALLVWGDPSLYDSTLRILERLVSKHGLDLEVEVIPGITSVQALTARHRIPLNTLGGPVLYTTGRRLREGIPEDVDTVVVVLDGEASFQSVLPGDFDIYWGACLGMPQEIAIGGPLGDVAGQIADIRRRKRAEAGWLMDVYILRRRRGGE